LLNLAYFASQFPKIEIENSIMTPVNPIETMGCSTEWNEWITNHKK